MNRLTVLGGLHRAGKFAVAALLAIVLSKAPSARAAQSGGPKPSPDELAQLTEKNAELAKQIDDLGEKTDPALRSDVEIFQRAVAYVLRFRERLETEKDVTDALAVDEEGLKRVAQLRAGNAPWTDARRIVCLGYQSEVDGSTQPYCVWVPKNYDPSVPMRMDVILHGRSARLTEVSFLTSGLNGKVVGTEGGRKGDPDCLKLYVFGRGNNSYRWAGESDVFEALASARKKYNVDPSRIVLRGFSMGGTGAWHLGLHFPSRWAAVEAGAGYVETRPEVLKTVHDSWQMEALTIHDAANCAVNMLDVPFVGYAGSKDPQREQNLIIEHDLEVAGYDPAKLPHARFMVGLGAGHTFLPVNKKESDAFLDSELPRRMPDSFRFVAYTPSYGEFWNFHIDQLGELYKRAELSGTSDDVHTSNIRALKLDRAKSIVIDGQALSGSEFYRTGIKWSVGIPAGLRKRAGLQGPIDDAFQQPFLCVEPSNGDDPVLRQFEADFAKYLHGSIRIKRADQVSADDVRRFNLVLFGTPWDNEWVRKVLPSLPVTWTKDQIVVDGRSYPASENTLALIYPNPLNPERYVVFNSGHTFPGEAFDDMHWYLYSRFGDYAVLDKETRTVKTAGFFDGNWRFALEEGPGPEAKK